MPKLNAEAKLFGVDLSNLGEDVRGALRQLVAVTGLHNVFPTSFLRLNDGHTAQTVARVRGSTWLGVDSAGVMPMDEKSPMAFTALLLDEQFFLLRTVSLPKKMPAKAVQSALRLEVQAASPFSEEETLWSYQKNEAEDSTEHGVADAYQCFRLIITSKSLVQAAMSKHGVDGQQTSTEIWVGSASQPILLKGFGEQLRLGREKRQNLMLLMGAVLVGVLLVAVAVTPTVQLYARAVDARSQLQALQSQTKEQLMQRQQLLSAVESLQQFQRQQNEQIDHSWLLQALTQALPDDVALQSLTVKGTLVTLQGVADNASTVVQLLAVIPGFKDVRFPSAVTRVANSSKESFVLTAQVDVQALHIAEKTSSPSADMVDAGVQQ